ncbi:MAG: DUF2279 domain-containing protein [Bacteroidota bacterium]
MKKTVILAIIILSHIRLAGQYQSIKTYPDTLNKTKLYTTVGIGAGAYIAGLSFLQFIWYKDHERVPFHYYDDSNGYLQMDKAGHAYGTYWESSIVYNALRKSGVSKQKALIYGGSAGLLFQTPIEIFDGLYEGWGFSWYDMIANTIGAGLFTVQEAFFDEQVVLMKFSYYPSPYPQYHHHLGESHIESFFLDYNAHTYWLSANLSMITGSKRIPPWLNIAFGYSANGMIYEFENPKDYRGEPFPYLRRYRQFLLSLDIDFSRIPTNKKWLKKVFNAINLVKIPFPALEYNNKVGLIFRYMYY